MRNRKKVVESAAVLCMVGALTVTAGFSANSEKENLSVQKTSEYNNNDVSEMESADEVLAEISYVRNQTDFVTASSSVTVGSGSSEYSENDTTLLSQLSVQTAVDASANAAEKKDGNGIENTSGNASGKTNGTASANASGNKRNTASANASGNASKKNLTEEEKEWKKYLMADVNEYMNIRAEKSEDSKIIGKLRKGDRALIKKKGKVWTKIVSGSAEGYVKNEYCVFGTDALEYAKKNCDRIATVTTDCLRVREKQNKKSKVLKILSEGDVLTVNQKKKTKEGWVAVKLDDTTAYVSADYVTLSYKTAKAITIEEEQEALRKAEEENSSSEGSSKKSKGSSVSATSDEKTLLAALIYCEAGGENYDCQIACGAVVINRIKSSRFPNNLYDVIYQRGQFGPAMTGKLERVLSRGVCETSLRAAEEVLSGADNTDGCLFFNDAFCGHDGLHIDTMVFWH